MYFFRFPAFLALSIFTKYFFVVIKISAFFLYNSLICEAAKSPLITPPLVANPVILLPAVAKVEYGDNPKNGAKPGR